MSQKRHDLAAAVGQYLEDNLGDDWNDNVSIAAFDYCMDIVPDDQLSTDKDNVQNVAENILRKVFN